MINIRYIARFAMTLTSVVMLASCVDSLQDVESAGAVSVSLELSCSEMVQTRAQGVDAYNENKINRLDCFFYPAESANTVNAAHHLVISGVDANSTYTVTQRLTNDQISAIFGDAGTTCLVYVIANAPSEITSSTATSISALKAITIANENFTSANVQDNFVMDSEGTDVVTLDRTARTLSGRVPLYRAASKISLFITEVSDVTEKDENGDVKTDADGNPIVWKANTGGMKVRLHYGVKKANLDNADYPYTVTTNDYFSFANGSERDMVADGSQWECKIPFYSYSSKWSEGSDKAAYLTLIVPWASSENPTYYRNTYYQIPVNSKTLSLLRNNHYKINLKVSRLGSFVEEVPVVITPSSYIILDWTTNTVSAELNDWRYLMVEEKDITIYNEDELYIPYVTSHEAEIVDITFYQQDITGADPEWEEISANSSNYFSNLELAVVEGNQILYKNVIDNVYESQTFDFTPYRVSFTIRHKDNENYYEVVTITQYPAIYGEAEQNWDYKNDYSGRGTDGDNGFTFVNGYQGTNNGNYDYFGSVNGLSGNSSSSPNRYVFTVTSVQGTDYIIGDPRDNTITYDEDDADWAVAKALYDGASNRELKYYYGTSVTSELYTTRTTTTAIYANDAEAEAAERTINMIAPKFRIASGYAVLGTSDSEVRTLENLKKRCASYQEDGYPAGRWRLPTRAEFQFIVSQVNKGTLPQIYIDNTAYWCAHGLGTPDNNGNVTMRYIARDRNGHSVRCVYDEWYWTDKLETPEEKNVFTWGDQPR